MPDQGFLLLLFPWARNFTSIASATHLLTGTCLCVSGHGYRADYLADAIIPIETKKIQWWY